MGPATEMQELANRTLQALDASHDYYVHTIKAWQLMRQIVKEGRRFRARNRSTGSMIDESELVARSRHYISNYLRSSTFQHFISLFEDFYFDLLRLWLTAYPGSLSRKQLEFTTVLRAVDKSAIVAHVIERELNELKYERVADWFAYLERLARLGRPSAEGIAKLAEMKASRDILVHSKSLVNATYVDKSGALARFKVGEIVELPEPYHRECWEAIKKLVQELADAVIAKSNADA